MKIPNYLLAFAGILLFLSFGHILVAYKYFLVLVHHGLYYCQEIVRSLNYQLPGEYGKILAGILLLAAVVTVLKLLQSMRSVYAFRKTLLKKKQEHRKDLAPLFKSLALQEKVLIFTQEKPQAFCFGVRNPKIYISTGLLRLVDQKELGVILRHEKYHLEHSDNLTLLLAAVIESLFPFFPVVSDFIRAYRTDREVAADKVAMTNPTDKQSLKDVLKKLIQYEPDTNPVFLPAMMSVDTLEARIRSINLIDTGHKMISIQNLSISALSLAVLLELMVTPVHAIELHEDGQDIVVLCSKQQLHQLRSTQPQYAPETVNSSHVQ